jgi:sugar (pentulose or hexulose) kinase
MDRWAGVADLAAFLLTGRLFTDHTLAGRTMAYRLPAPDLSATFDAGLLAEVGLRPSQLPAVTSEPFGVTNPDFVHSGLARGTPVVVAGHDHQVGSFACGVREPGDVADSLGTAEAVLTVMAGDPDPVRAGDAGMSTVVTVSGRHRAVLAGSSSAGAVVDWWLSNESGGATREELFGEVLACDDRPTGVLVLPYLSGRQTPAPDPGARLRVIGRHPGRAVMAKAMLEGLCLHTRWMLAEQARLLGGPGAGAGERIKHSTVSLFGGAVAANQAWTRMKARVLPGTLRVVPAEEPVAVGAAVIAATRAAVEAPVLGSTVTPGAGTAYDDMYSRFVAAAQETE